VTESRNRSVPSAGLKMTRLERGAPECFAKESTHFRCSKITPTMQAGFELVIRSASQDDAATIALCLLEAFVPYRAAYTPLAFADTVPTADQVLIRIQQMTVLVATAGGKIIGTISATADGEHGHLRGMAVLPEWRGKGTAAQLLATIENWLRSRGCRAVALDTTEPLKSAISFYEKHGYSRSGNVSDFFGMPLIEYSKRL
jgi:GNAT superfamily N-acetyltransferase